MGTPLFSADEFQWAPFRNVPLCQNENYTKNKLLNPLSFKLRNLLYFLMNS